MPHIRKAQLADTEAINRLLDDLGYEVAEPEVADARIGGILDSAEDHLWVCESEGQIMGWIHFFKARRVAYGPFIEIGGLVVSANQRKKGLGNRLVGQAVKWARENHMKVRVRCNVKRTGSHIFYESIGFSTGKSQHVFETQP